MRSFLSCLFVWLAACNPADTTTSIDPAIAGDGSTQLVDSGVGTTAETIPQPPTHIGPEDRPAAFLTPPNHDGLTPLPLLVVLHGYAVNAALQDVYLGISRISREEGFYVILPDGIKDSQGQRFWNAGACCNLDNNDVDDVAYLTALLDEAESTVPVDPNQIFFFGHSNGGFMSYRMACELSERISAIATLAGSDYDDPEACVPSQPVSVLHVHGTNDDLIAYEGSEGRLSHPSADEVLRRWAIRANCDPEQARVLDERRDYDSTHPDAETMITEYLEGCANGSNELWTLEGSAHIPPLRRRFTTDIFRWLSAHGR